MDLVEQKPVVPPLQRQLQLETDFFCFQCGYNLHGQVVTRDERLDILICRCPECGRFHPAAMGVSATRPWLARAGVALIGSWVLFALGVTLVLGFFMGLLNYAHLEYYTTMTHFGTPGNSEYLRIIRDFDPARAGGYSYRSPDTWKWMAFWSALCAVVFGCFAAVALWHVPKKRLLWTLVFPILVALATFGLWQANENIRLIIEWSIGWVGIYGCLNVAFVALGLWIGRPVARFIVKVIVSPRLRQHVHFLWTCDGLTPPTVKDASAGVPA